MYNPIAAAALARALHADRLAQAEAARLVRRARQARRGGQRHEIEIGVVGEPAPTCL